MIITGALLIVLMTAGAIGLYRHLTQSGVLLRGTWTSQDTIIKTDGKTAELYRRGAAEAAVLSIYGVKDRLLADGEIEYTAELDFPHRCEEVSIVYSNHGGAVYLEIEWQDGRSEIFLFE